MASLGILFFIIAYYIGVPNYGSANTRGSRDRSLGEWIRRNYENRDNVISTAIRERNWTIYSANERYQTDSVNLHDTRFDFTGTLSSSERGLLIIADDPKHIDMNRIDSLNFRRIIISIIENYPSQHYTDHDQLMDLFPNTEISIQFIAGEQQKEKIIHDSFCMYGSACPYE
jgi:hypothetical protein